jgi:hypothetical protein
MSSPPARRPRLPGRPPWAADALALLALLGFALALTAPVLRGLTPVPTDTLPRFGTLAALDGRPANNTIITDGALLFLPWQVFERQSLAAGEWPLWNADLFAGYPFLGNAQNQLYYPITWLLWLLPLATAFAVSAPLHLWLAGAGMYLFARVLGASRAGSLLAGLAFAANGQILTGLEVVSVADIAVWLPWVAAAAEMAWRRRSWAWTAGAGLLFGVLAVSGHLPWFVYSSLFLALWLGGRVLALAVATARGAAGVSRSALAGQAARAGAILLWGPALAAIHLLPFGEMLALSSRVAQAFRVPRSFDWDLRALTPTLRLVAPRFFGDAPSGVGEPINFNNCWYFGLAALALAPLALLRRERRLWYLAGLGLAAFGVACGWPGLNLLHTLPGLQTSIPGRMAYLTIFAGCALGARGYDTLLDLARRSWRRAGAALLALAAAGVALGAELVARHGRTPGPPALLALQSATLGQVGLIASALALWGVAVLAARGGRSAPMRAALAGALLLVSAGDLLTYAPNYNTYVAPETLLPRARATNIIKADPDLGRVITTDHPGPVLIPNTATLYGVRDVQGYDSLHLASYDDFWLAADPSLSAGSYFNVIFRPQAYASAQARLLNVRYVLAASPLDVVEQRQADVAAPELAGHSVGQTFAAPEGLSSLTVAFDTLGRANHAPVTLRVRRALTDTLDLVTRTVDPTAWTGRPWITFAFPALDAPAGTPLAFLLEAPDRPGETPAPLQSSGDAYAPGALYHDGAARPYDLGFVARGRTPAHLEPIYQADLTLYRKTDGLPRAFTVARAEVAPAAEIPGRVAAPGFDPAAGILIERPAPAGFADTGAGAPGTATVTRYRNLSVEVDAQMTRAGWLVLGDVNYPGWTATVDGRAAAIYTADGALRAVPLPPGAHVVRFEFRPLSVALGGAISGLALLAAGGALLAGPLRRRAQARGARGGAGGP